MKVLVIGGTGVISRAVVLELLRCGHAVTIVTRGRSSTRPSAAVEWLKIDRADPDGFSALFASRQFDAVIDMICFTGREAEQTLAVFGDKSNHIVIVSSVAAYRRPLNSLPTREDAEVLWDDPSYTYGFRKAEMERYLRVRIAAGARVTIVRPSLTFGPGARNVGVLRQNMGIITRIRAGKPLIMFGDGTTPWGFGFAEDVASAMVQLLDNERAVGAEVHIGSEEPTEWRDFYAAFGRIAGREPELEYVPARSLWQASPGRFDHLHFEKSHPGLFDLARLRQLIPGFTMRTSLEDGLRALVASWQADGLEPDPLLDQLEDRLTAVARQATASVQAALALPDP